MTYKEMADYLKCSHDSKTKCNPDCPYCLKEVTNPDFPFPADIVIDGVGYWLNCDYDRVTEDAIVKLIEAMEE